MWSRPGSLASSGACSGMAVCACFCRHGAGFSIRPRACGIWERVDADFRRAAKENGVGAYALNEMELPAAMEKYGFRDVETHYLAINLTPDDPFYAPEEACDMINANRQNDLDNIERMESVAPGAVSRADREMLARLVNERYDRRLALYAAGKKQWDVTLGLTMLLRGVK